MLKSLIFNDVKKSWIYLLAGRTKAPFAPIQRTFVSVSGMPGAHLSKTEIGLLYIQQPVGFIVNDDADALHRKDEIAEWLFTENFVSLEFEDEPGRIYHAVVEGTIEDYQKFVEQRKGTISFVAMSFSDGQEITESITASPYVINYQGTAPTYPNVKVTFTTIATEFVVENDKGAKVRIIYNFAMNDVLEIDFEKEKVWINGILQMTAWDLTGDGFPLTKGNNNLTITPVSAGTIEVTYIERWR